MLRRFEGKIHAEDYARYRPTWPPIVFEKLVSYIKDGGGDLQLAVDVGCGTGISTKLLAEYFEKVIGVDVSEAMLAEAPQDLPNVSYHCGPGEDLAFLSNESVDAITCAASIHWFDLKRFHKEVDRVLRPNGVLASFTYTKEYLLGNEAANAKYEKFHDEILSKYYDQAALDSQHIFHEWEQPYTEYERHLELPLVTTWHLSDFLGFVSTISAGRKLIESGSKAFDMLTHDLLQIYKRQTPGKDKLTPDDVEVTTQWNVMLNLSRKPQNGVNDNNP